MCCVPLTPHQRILGACLSAGPPAVASHRSAGWLWGLVHSEPPTIEITVPFGYHRRVGATVVHQALDAASQPVHWKTRVPVTDPLRTVFDLAGVLRFPALENAVDAALASRLINLAGLVAELGRRQVKSRRGGPALRAILADRGMLHGPAPSVLEARMERLLHGHGLPPPVRELLVEADGHRYRLDFAYPKEAVAVETDGYENHATPRARDADSLRQNALLMAGWRILRFTWGDVTRDPRHVAAQIRELLDNPPPQSLARPETGALRTSTGQIGSPGSPP